jgi:murein DD-endopeptidase MepM/ murein hydrolase activator NlpD
MDRRRAENRPGMDRRRAENRLRTPRTFSWRRALTLVRLTLTGLVIAAGLSALPSTEAFHPDQLPFYGDFAWNSDDPVRFSAGDFLESGRGGLDDYIPNLRLIEYEIQRGDTLWDISRKFGVDPDSIISTNVFTNVHAIQPGDTILVPNLRGIFVRVDEGDTILKYATNYKVAPDFIMEVNRLNSNQLVPGQKLFLPGVRFQHMERAYALGEAFAKPVRGRLTSRFGFRIDPFTRRKGYHTGIDIAAPRGTPVHAAQGGRVIFAGPKYGYGNAVIIDHRFGYSTLYGHLDSWSVRRGQRVRSGQVVGRVGSTGRSTGPHVHFEIWLRNRKIDPLTQTNMSVR